jgi:hypothetical protein
MQVQEDMIQQSKAPKSSTMMALPKMKMSKKSAAPRRMKMASKG